MTVEWRISVIFDVDGFLKFLVHDSYALNFVMEQILVNMLLDIKEI